MKKVTFSVVDEVNVPCILGSELLREIEASIHHQEGLLITLKNQIVINGLESKVHQEWLRLKSNVWINQPSVKECKTLVNIRKVNAVGSATADSLLIVRGQVIIEGCEDSEGLDIKGQLDAGSEVSINYGK